VLTPLLLTKPSLVRPHLVSAILPAEVMLKKKSRMAKVRAEKMYGAESGKSRMGIIASKMWEKSTLDAAITILSGSVIAYVLSS
jgi:hypothetical protein